jgi:hypothetical protein
VAEAKIVQCAADMVAEIDPMGTHPFPSYHPAQLRKKLWELVSPNVLQNRL